MDLSKELTNSLTTEVQTFSGMSSNTWVSLAGQLQLIQLNINDLILKTTGNIDANFYYNDTNHSEHYSNNQFNNINLEVIYILHLNSRSIIIIVKTENYLKTSTHQFEVIAMSEPLVTNRKCRFFVRNYDSFIMTKKLVWCFMVVVYRKIFSVRKCRSISIFGKIYTVIVGL